MHKILEHIMQQEIRFATFNVRNLALAGMKYYDDQEPFTVAEYDAKVDWLAHQIDLVDADVIGFQEIFSQAALRDVLARSQHYREAHHVGFDPDPGLSSGRLTPNVALVSRLPVTANIATYLDLPRTLSVDLPGTTTPVNALHASDPACSSDRVAAVDGQRLRLSFKIQAPRLPQRRRGGGSRPGRLGDPALVDPARDRSARLALPANRLHAGSA